MTFKQFRTDVLGFVGGSKVNLGRNNTRTREDFLNTLEEKFDAFGGLIECGPATNKKKKKEKKKDGLMDDRVMRIKPSDSRKGLSVGKGVHAMTGSESMRADEQLGRSPFTGKGEGK